MWKAVSKNSLACTTRRFMAIGVHTELSTLLTRLLQARISRAD